MRIAWPGLGGARIAVFAPWRLPASPRPHRRSARRARSCDRRAAASPSAARSPPSSGPPDTDAFFNYTDYEHNALRSVRLRVLGEWRLPSRLVAARGGPHRERADAGCARRCTCAGARGPRRDLDIQAGPHPARRRRVCPARLRARQPADRHAARLSIPDLAAARRAAAHGRRSAAYARPRLAAVVPARRADARRAGIPLVSGSQLGHRRRGAPRRLPRGCSPRALTRGAAAVPVVRETNDGHILVGPRRRHGSCRDSTLGALGPARALARADASSRCSRRRAHGAVQSLVGTDGEFGWGHCSSAANGSAAVFRCR